MLKKERKSPPPQGLSKTQLVWNGRLSSFPKGWAESECERHLCSSAPVEPAHVGRVSEVGVDPAGDQHVALGLLVLDDVVEVGAGRQHGRLAQDFATQHHEQPHATQPLELLQL